MKTRFLVCFGVLMLLTALACGRTMAQKETKASGVVVDAQTGDPVPFVGVFFVGTQMGATSDFDGNFEVSNTGGYITLGFQSMGYKTLIVSLKYGQDNADLKIRLEPDVFQLQVIEVKPPKRKEKYVKKGNPAVELIKEVIAHKDSNRADNEPAYKAQLYEKRVLAIENDSFNFQKNGLMRKMSFLKEYVDSSELNGKDILTVSFKENKGDFYYRRKPRSEKRTIEAERLQGIEAATTDASIWTNLEQMLPMVNVFENDISLLLNKFTGPLSSTIATGFYQYFIFDTVEVNGDRCVDLAFVPTNNASCGFIGHLYILTDGSYAVKRVRLNVPVHINLNFVSNLNIQQEFKRLDNGLWGLAQTDTYVNFYIFRKKRQLYAHQTCVFGDYDFSVTENDTVFAMKGDLFKPKFMEKLPRDTWDAMRPVKLTAKEGVIDSMITEMNRVPAFRSIIRTVQVFASSYIPTTKNIKESKFDIGPFWSFVSWNKLERVRVRLGGMTTANLHPHIFFSGYVAAGTSDWADYSRRFGALSGAEHGLKYNAALIYSFDKKKYHPYEAWRNYIELSTEFETYEPGRLYTMFDKDNIFMNIPFGIPKDKYMQYVRRTQLKYEKEWPNRMRIKTWVEHEINEAAGTLEYKTYGTDGALHNAGKFRDVEYGLELRYAPGEPLYDNRAGRESLFNLSTDAPVVKISHRIGAFDYKYIYNFTEFSVDYRIWMSSFGHIDVTFRTGMQWNRVPYPKLYLPNINQSVMLQPKSFSMLQPLEFISDQYMVLHLTYYMKGLIFNRIPGIKRLGLREVVSFSALYGRLSPKNNPNYNKDGVLYVLPETSHAMGMGLRYNGTNDKVPYMEMSVGIENILKFIRIDYVRRINYIGGMGPWQRNGIRVSFRFTL